MLDSPQDRPGRRECQRTTPFPAGKRIPDLSHTFRELLMIRPTVPADTPVLLQLAEGTGVFKPHEIEALKEVLDDFHAHNAQLRHRCVIREDRGKVLGFAYYAPAAMTDRTWYLYWIAVSKTIQAKGI